MRILFAVLMLSIAAIGFATEALVSLDTVIHGSDRIVRGRVVSLNCRRGTNDFGDDLIYTDISIETHETLMGDRSNLLLTIEGGTVNGITLKVSDVPEFHPGDEVLVFTKKEGASNFLSFGSQSKYSISTSGRIRENGVYYGDFKKNVMEIVSGKRGGL